MLTTIAIGFAVMGMIRILFAVRKHEVSREKTADEMAEEASQKWQFALGGILFLFVISCFHFVPGFVGLWASAGFFLASFFGILLIGSFAFLFFALALWLLKIFL